jgi:glycosyltransferase involved in cell wall biosynthesis
MRILAITAGAAGMYCGSCMRDNALAAELMREGHDVILLPLYTPTRTDETNVSDRHLFFGGIHVYLEVKYKYFRRRHRWLDWLLDNPKLIGMLTKNSSTTDPHMLGEFTVSVLEGEHGPHKVEVEKLTEWLEHEPATDIVSLPYTLLISLAEPLKKALGCPISCALAGEELFLDNLIEPYRGRALKLIREQIHHVDVFTAVSEYEADYMSEFLGIPRDRIHVVGLGINLEGHSPKPHATDGPFRIGYMARVAPEKGLHLLAEAYRELRQRDLPPSRLEVAGYLRGEHAEYLEEVERKMREWGLADEFHYHGEMTREGKIEFLQGLDVLSVPCTYDEPKGIFVLEAMANGVPVVQPRRGGFPETIERTGGGLLVEPDDPVSLADGIQQVWQNKDLARRLSEAGRAGIENHYLVSHMARRTFEAFSGTLLAAQVNS